ncbi:MAG TPA: 16S rRNA (guanine(966)-N(2))-methyltransferase RsmD [Gammaproteobacteria bacterium]|nr:16S rRNA (guanine(966)-N(2))-methyltransferase RsmD [Gammaproteobacteria bacterium]
MAQGIIRIIGGEWRGRKLKVPDIVNLRPTPDRVRETLFNWLAPTIAGAHCLDAFAGSGALGFEALSRRAADVVMVDESPAVISLLQAELKIFKAENAEIYCANVPSQLRQPSKPFDIVFLDPPYQKNILLPCCFYLEEKDFLADTAQIYLEARETLDEKDLPPHWRIVKSKRAGQVAYHLIMRKYTSP